MSDSFFFGPRGNKAHLVLQLELSGEGSGRVYAVVAVEGGLPEVARGRVQRDLVRDVDDPARPHGVLREKRIWV